MSKKTKPRKSSSLPEPLVPDYLRAVPHPEDRFFDKVSIDMEERWKQSYVTGAEWRFSYVIKLHRRGSVIAERVVHSLSYATIAAAEAVSRGWGDIEFDKAWDTSSSWYPDALCCHPGCSQEATHVYVLVRRYADGNAIVVPNDEDGEPMACRRFCKSHILRGDCDLDDADRNYLLARQRSVDGRGFVVDVPEAELRARIRSALEVGA